MELSMRLYFRRFVLPSVRTSLRNCCIFWSANTFLFSLLKLRFPCNDQRWPVSWCLWFHRVPSVTSRLDIRCTPHAPHLLCRKFFNLINIKVKDKSYGLLCCQMSRLIYHEKTRWNRGRVPEGDWTNLLLL